MDHNIQELLKALLRKKQLYLKTKSFSMYIDLCSKPIDAARKRNCESSTH